MIKIKIYDYLGNLIAKNQSDLEFNDSEGYFLKDLIDEQKMQDKLK